MAIYKLPYFGEIEMASLEEYYSVKVEYAKEEITLDLNFEKKFIETPTMDIVKYFIENISQIDKQNKSLYFEDYEKNGETADYIEFYFEEFNKDELTEILNLNEDEPSQKLQLLNKLELKRVGMYPDEKYGASYFGVFDYSIKIDDEYCNQLLVVKTTNKGTLDHITWES